MMNRLVRTATFMWILLAALSTCTTRGGSAPPPPSAPGSPLGSPPPLAAPGGHSWSACDGPRQCVLVQAAPGGCCAMGEFVAVNARHAGQARAAWGMSEQDREAERRAGMTCVASCTAPPAISPVCTQGACRVVLGPRQPSVAPPAAAPVVPATNPYARSPRATQCSSDANCVVSTFSGCCDCCGCTSHAYAVNRDFIRAEHNTCDAVRCDMRRCAAVDCGPCPTEDHLSARCDRGTCVLR